MSGYDASTGVFELTPSTVGRWLRRPSDQIRDAPDTMSAAAALMRQRGLDVLRASATHILVRAKQALIWEALSGQSSTFIYGENDRGPGYYSATYLAHIVVPQLTAVKLNRFLEEAGLSRRNGDQWEITARGKPFGMYVGFSGPRRSGKNDSRVIHWCLEVLDSLALYWPRPSETGDVGQHRRPEMAVLR